MDKRKEKRFNHYAINSKKLIVIKLAKKSTSELISIYFGCIIEQDSTPPPHRATKLRKRSTVSGPYGDLDKQKYRPVILIRNKVNYR